MNETFLELLINYLEHCVTGPNLPATVLMCLILAYGLIALLGLFDFEMFDLDLGVDVDADADVDILSNLGFVTLKFFNLGRLPLMIWVSAFGLSWWVISMTLWLVWDLPYEPSWWMFAQILVRNIVLAAFVTKFLTKPLIPMFEPNFAYEPENLIGKECVVTSETTMTYGQAKFRTEGAPLLLNVRSKEGVLAKGDRAILVEFEPENRVYLITPVEREVQT